MKWSGVKTYVAEMGAKSLVELNDQGVSFKQIAKSIKEHAEKI